MEHERHDRFLDDPRWLQWAASLPSRPLYLTGQATGLALMTGRLLIKGFSLRNTATTAGQCDLIDGSSNNGNVFATNDIAGSGSLMSTFGSAGLVLEQGLFVNPVSGAYTGAIWVVPLWRYPFTPAPD